MITLMSILNISVCFSLILKLTNSLKDQHKKKQSYYEMSDKADLIAEYNEMLRNITTYDEFFNKSHASPKLQSLSLAQDREDLWLFENFFFGLKVYTLLNVNERDL